jgi:hypothetical protein
LIYLQFHSTFGDENCVASNLESIRLSTIVALVTDIVLLTIMLIGLARMRRHGGGTMALGRLLWKQVGRCSKSSWQPPCSRLIENISIRKGVIWLVVSVVAELTPTVS